VIGRKEGLLRNNYDRVVKVISHELSGALHPTGAQNQTQSRVAGTNENDGARGLVNGQQPQPVPTARSINEGVKRDGDRWSLARRHSERLKWRYHSRTIGYYAQWAGHYSGVRYLLQYMRHQTVHPQLMPISECVKRTTGESSEISQKLQVMTGSSPNDSSASLECHDCPAIRCTSTPCSQAEGSIVEMQPERDATSGAKYDEHRDRYQCIRQLPMNGQSVVGKIGYTAFPETSRKFITNLHQHSTKECYLPLSKTRQKRMRKPKCNCKFTGCMQNKRRLSMETCNNCQSLCTSDGNIEPLWIGGREKLQRNFHSNVRPRVKMQQCTLTYVATPAFNATADWYASTTSARTCASGTFTAMSTSSPTPAFPQEIERCTTATNARFNAILLQNVGLNTSSSRAVASKSKSMLSSYVHSFERGRPRVCMARTKGSLQRDRGEGEQECDDSRRTDERHKAGPSKKGRRRHSPRPSQYICFFCRKVNRQRTNHKRHLIMKHNCRLDGTEATAADLAQARAWSSKIPADRSQYYKSKEFVSSDSDDSASESSGHSSSSRCDSPSPPRQVKKAKRELSESPPRHSVPLSRSSSPSKSAPPKVRKVRFEIDEPVSERGETSRARKRPVKTAPSSPKAATTVPSIMELDVTEPEPRKFVKAQRSKKDTAAVRSEVHTVTKPLVTKKKATKSSAVSEAQGKVATP